MRNNNFGNQRNNEGGNITNHQSKKELNDKPDLKNFKSSWINSGADKDMILFAELCGQFLANPSKNVRPDKDNQALSNSQIRNIFGEIKRIQMGGYDKNKTGFLLLKPKMAYAAGRIDNQGMKFFKQLFDRAWIEVEDETTFEYFEQFVEAILAYHKANGGK